MMNFIYDCQIPVEENEENEDDVDEYEQA